MIAVEPTKVMEWFSVIVLMMAIGPLVIGPVYVGIVLAIQFWREEITKRGAK